MSNIKFIILILAIYNISCLKSKFKKEDEDDIILRATTSDKTIDLFTMLSTYESALTLPKDKLKIYQIPEGRGGKYKVISGNSVSVNIFGTITPVNETWYWYTNGWGYPYPREDLTLNRIEVRYTLGTSVVSATIGDKTYKITVNVKDYPDEYVEDKLSSYLAKNVTVQKTQLDKLKSITAYPAQFSYNGLYHDYKSMVIFEGGDCWASADIIHYLCQRVGIKSHIRYAANDAGAASGHKNVVALIGSKFYKAEAGLYYEKPRPYYVTDLNVGYSIKTTTEGIIIYQYDGYDVNVKVPSTIDSKTVIGLISPVFYNGFESGKNIKTITLPDTIQSIGDYAFSGLINITTIKIPKNVNSIGKYVFAGSDNLATINVNSSNKYFASASGIVYNKAKTEIVAFPTGKKANYTGLSSLKSIGAYSFYFVKNILKITIPSSVTSIGEGAFKGASIKEIYFEGDPPTFGQFCFHSLNVSIYYPKGNSKWKVDSIGTYKAKEIRWIQWTPPSSNTNLNIQTSNQKEIYIAIGVIVIIFLLVILFIRRRIKNKYKNKGLSNIEFDSNGLMA